MCNLDEIKLLVEDRQIDVLCISETWLSPDLPDHFIDIPNYNLYRCDYGKGGGVCIYVKIDLKIKVLNLEIEKLEGVEHIWLTIQHRMLPSVIIGCVYRHPKAAVNSFEYISNILKIICMKKKPIFVLGDLNDNQFNPNSKLIKIVKRLNLNQLIKKPTRITRTSSTLLDVIITNNVEKVIQSDVYPGPVADHELISVCIDIKKPKKIPQQKRFRCKKQYSPDHLCNLLLEKT